MKCMSEKVDIIIAEDHPLYRSTIIKELKCFNINCIGEAANGKELFNFLDPSKSSIVLLDLEMPEMDGKQALLKIKAEYPLVKVLIVSQYDDLNIIQHFQELGADGYLPKNYISDDLKVLADAICDLSSNKKHFVYFSSDKKYIKYTKRERELIPLICDGKTSKEMASSLGLGEKAIEKHRTNLLEKTGSKTVATFIKFSIRRGLDFLGGS